MKRFFCALFLILAIARADARAAFQSSEQMIATSQAIAIVQIEKTETVNVKGENWTYRQRATATVEKILKGHLPKKIALYGDETFICARCHFSTSKMLVFLKRSGDLWTGNNWHLGARPIQNDQIEWLGDKGVFDLKFQPLAKVLENVEKTIETQAKAPKFNISFLKIEIPVWRIYETGTGEKQQSFSREELEKWLGNLPIGSQIAYDRSCTGSNPDAATLQELENICWWRGLSWKINPAG